MKIQKFNEYKINENIISSLSKYGYDIKIENEFGDVDDIELKDEKNKLDIIKKYFPFSKVTGKTIYGGDAMVDFIFDDKFTIKGMWNTHRI